MDTSAPELDLLERALDQTARIIATVRPEQESAPTPCHDWDVHALLTHVVRQSMRNFTVAARGEMADWQAPADDPGDDWATAFRAGAGEMLDIWRSADLDRLVPGLGGEAPLRTRISQQLAELATHGWDLAKATGQSTDLDPDLAEHALRWSKSMLRPEFRGKAFGPEVDVPADAPSYARLAAWFGRDPDWTPPA